MSFYNQSADDGPVFPTPTIGMLGVLQDISNRMTLDFKESGHLIYLIGEPKEELNSSEYLYNVMGIKESPAPHFDLEEESRLQTLMTELIRLKRIQSAHDVSDGGLWITLLESAMVNNLGFDITTDDSMRRDCYLFGESQSRVVVSVREEEENAFLETLMKHTVDFTCIGEVTPQEIFVDDEDYGDIETWKEQYEGVIGKMME